MRNRGITFPFVTLRNGDEVPGTGLTPKDKKAARDFIRVPRCFCSGGHFFLVAPPLVAPPLVLGFLVLGFLVVVAGFFGGFSRPPISVSQSAARNGYSRTVSWSGAFSPISTRRLLASSMVRIFCGFR